jgi:hypothetical protein
MSWTRRQSNGLGALAGLAAGSTKARPHRTVDSSGRGLSDFPA